MSAANPAARFATFDSLRSVLAALVAALFATVSGIARAHEFTLDVVMNAFAKVDANEAHLVIRAPLYLFKAAKFPVRGTEVDVEHANAALDRALAGLQKGLTLTEDGRPLTARSANARLALPSDRSFDDYERAARHVAMPVEGDTRIVVDQGYVDAHIVYPIRSPNAVFALRSTIAPELGDYLKLTVRYLPAQGKTRALVIRSGAGAVDLNPTRWAAASGFIGLGIAHIGTGFDHLLFLLFLLCLIIPLHGVRQLVTIVTAFTLAHTFTLLGSAFGLAPQGAWFSPFVETLIALWIVYTALENVVAVSLPRRVLLSDGVRTRARLRLLAGVAAGVAVRRLASASRAVRVQHRHRDRPADRTRFHAAAALARDALHAERPDRLDHPRRAVCARRLALDDRSLGCAHEDAVAELRCCEPDLGSVLGGRSRAHSRCGAGGGRAAAARRTPLAARLQRRRLTLSLRRATALASARQRRDSLWPQGRACPREAAVHALTPHCAVFGSTSASE
jgi:hypothetical protein